MRKIAFLITTACFSFASASETNNREELATIPFESEIEKLTEQKKALNEMYSELTDDQKAALEEEFQLQMEELNKKLEQLDQDIEE